MNSMQTHLITIIAALDHQTFGLILFTITFIYMT